MQKKKLTKAIRAYRTGDYCGALRLYYELASANDHKLFYANIALCLSKLNADDQDVIRTCNNLAKHGQFDLLNALYARNIVVSLTSYPARINTISETISSIIAQSLQPGTLVLWLAEEQFPAKEEDLPPKLVQLKHKGLSIEWCEDLRSYKKLIPSLTKYPERIIVTADDDIIYSKNWLAQLVIAHIQEPHAIVCHRAHRVSFDSGGNFSPYRNWLKEIKEPSPSFGHLFTGCGGVLYPPGCLHQSVLNRDLFSTTCPTGDDLWFWGMAVLNGTKIHVVPNSSFELHFVPGTQTTALWINNVQDGANDAMLRKLHARYPDILGRLQETKEPPDDFQPRVSIIIPVFNTGKYLSACLDSIIHQDFENFEVLCIDDGSTDALTQDILTQYSRKESRIRVIRQRNSGPATARNSGLMNAKGDYIAFVDSDDYISERYIRNLYERALQKGADIAVADTILCVNGSNPPVLKKSGFELHQTTDAKHLAAQAIVTTGVSWNKLYKREFLLRNKIEYLNGARCQSEDNYFSIMALIAGHKNIAFAEDATYFYRQHEGGITKNVTKDSIDKSILIYEQIIERISDFDVPDRRYWLNVICQRASRDLRFLSNGFANREDIEHLLLSKFPTLIDICCIADKKYVAPTLVFLESIKRVKRKTTIPSITVLVPKGSGKEMAILQETSEKDFIVNVQEIDSNQFQNMHKYKEQDNFCMASPSAMFKFIIPNIFTHLDRILYIDTDLIVRKDLLELFMTSMDEEYLSAVPDLWNPVTDRGDIKQFAFYFNSGVMLMNLAKMRSENISARLIEAKIKSTSFDLMDQDIFNEVCNGRVRALDIRFNFLPVCYKRHKHRFKIDAINKLYGSNYPSIEEIASDPVVAHWAGSDKPWVSTSTLFSDEWVSIYNSLKIRGLMTGLDFAPQG